MTFNKQLRKTAASFLKRFFMLTAGGYSVGTAYGARFLFDWRHSLDKKVALELYEHDQLAYLASEVDRIQPDLFLDIGSHAALYSIVMKTRQPELEVHAFEPDRTNLCQLYANLFVNKLQSDIQVHEHGLSDRNGMVSFDTSAETSSRGTRRVSSTGNCQIQVRRLDDVLTDRGRIALIKIDVEGHESAVVDGASDFLAGNRCYLQIESSPEAFSNLKQQLLALGYRHTKSLCGNDHYFSNLDH